MIIARAYITISNVNDGQKGDTGDNALTLVCTPATLAFETNREGEIENTAQRKVQAVLYLGKTAVTPISMQITPYNCYARLVEQNIVVDGISPNQWSGHIAVTATYGGQTRTARVEFVVNAQKWNEAKFEANQKQFQSIIAQNTADKQGLEQKISAIKQTADNIQLEVRQQTFSGVNLLKGASLRPLNLLSIDRPHVTIVNYPSVAHFDNPYLSISRHGATKDEWNGCKFPIITIQGGKTYTLSMFTRIYGSEQPYIEVKRSRSKDMSAPKNSYPNIPSTYGVWKLYTYTFEMEEGYNYLQIFIYLTRNGEAYLSEIQLEEGTKATTWKDPDVVESMQAAGIYLNGNDMSINARAKHFNYIDQQGNIVASVDETGAIDGLKFRTRNLGAGYIDLTGAMMQVFGAVARNIAFGLDEKGQAALKFYNNAGRNTLTISPDGTKAENMRIANFSSLEVCYIGGMQVAGYPAEHRIFDPFFTDRKPIGTSVYMYSAAQIDSVYIADGDWTQEQVKNNNGRYFQRDMAVASNYPVNGVYAACQPQVKLRDNGGPTNIAKEWSTITIYIFRDGRISTTYLRRERNL
ncbi:hypothetical protein [Prevotella pallens]|uniref:hypothetical protein n=1 Tax=Prevotella pallens TaxID=60133 RepID=UPI001CB0A97F|nr:hypothetical protein [Prevotella pallens]MBF1465244.1 hypothetical protein [Prevotella pallens]